MTAPTVPQEYKPALQNDDSLDTAFWMRELGQLSRSIHILVQLCPQAATRAPLVPMEGMIRYAKSPWYPVSGQSADAWVTYVNGAWAFLKNS